MFVFVFDLWMSKKNICWVKVFENLNLKFEIKMFIQFVKITTIYKLQIFSSKQFIKSSIFKAKILKLNTIFTISHISYS